MDAGDKFLSTSESQSGILMDVHPVLLFREIDRLGAINFPQVGLDEQPTDSSQLMTLAE